MNKLTRPINEDFIALTEDTEHWLESAKFYKGKCLEIDCGRSWYRIVSRFIKEPRRYVKAVQVYGRMGGYAIHNSLEVKWLQEPPKIDTLSWNLSGGCTIMSPDLLGHYTQTPIEQVDNETRGLVYARLSDCLGKIVPLTAPYGVGTI